VPPGRRPEPALEAAASPALSALLPAAAATAELRDDPGEVPLFPVEAEAVAGAVPARRRHFAAGRACARTALASLGLPAAAIPRRAGGAPGWPPGVVGSITHCEGFGGAAVAAATDLSCLGIDAEPNQPLPEEVLALVVSSEEERRSLGRLQATEPQACADRLLFSAKESAYKAWSTTHEGWLDFADASVAFDPRRRRFQVHLNGARPAPVPYEGRWSESDGILLTAVAVPGRT
jgi:4'-phosphopantetheinyl transferase EntD